MRIVVEVRSPVICDVRHGIAHSNTGGSCLRLDILVKGHINFPVLVFPLILKVL